MKARVLVAAAGVPFLLLILAWAPVWAAAVLVAVMCAAGSYELMHAVLREKRDWLLLFLPGLTAAALVVRMELGRAPWPLWFAFLLALFCYSILSYGGEHPVSFGDLTAALFAGIAFPLMLSCLLRLRLLQFGVVWVFVPLAIAFGSDTFALFAGMLFGKHKLAPYVSPKKTVEGGVGGLVGGVIGLLLLKWITELLLGQPLLSYTAVVLLGVTGSVISQIGDLSFSVIKREYSIKDYGKLLPGHGGVLDRFDSVTFVAPFVWWVAAFLR